MTVASRRAWTGACLLALALASGVAPAAGVGATRTTALVPVRDADLPSFLDDGDAHSLRQAIQQSLRWLARQPSEQRIIFGPRVFTVAEQIGSLRRMLELLADDPPAEVLEDRVLAVFDVLKSAGADDGAMLVTGYHEPIIDAAETPNATYRVPIHGVPRDLRAGRGGPYRTRAEIEQGRLGNLAPPIAWARDPIDVFFMEIEGSGTLRLASGRELRVGHAATNGRPYRSIARLLINEGRLTREAMSMRVLREWLAANPGEQARVLRHNESYVFFHVLTGAPVGSLGVPLTPGRSIATDPRVFPRGSLAFIRTMRPVDLPDGVIGWKPFNRFVLSQDAGGAIRGPERVDIFWGRGPQADLAASDMKEPGELYFLVPRADGAVVARARRPKCCEPAQTPPNPAGAREVEGPLLLEEPLLMEGPVLPEEPALLEGPVLLEGAVPPLASPESDQPSD
jgi:peptidoglycan lytic transglycosylase A